MWLSGKYTSGLHRLAPPAGLPVHLASVLAFGDRLALLELPPAPREPELDLGQSVREVHAERDQREPLLGRRADQALDLLAVEQQLAGADRLPPGLVHRLLVGRDVHALEPDLVASDPRVGLGE